MNAPEHSAAARRRMIATQADSCVQWLKVQGLDVMYVDKAARLPRIVIFPSSLCAKFEGAVHRYERGPQGEWRYMMVERCGCEVRWADNGGCHAEQ